VTHTSRTVKIIKGDITHQSHRLSVNINVLLNDIVNNITFL